MDPPPETPDRDGAFPRLAEEQIAALSRDGEQRRTEAGEVLFHQGDRHYDFYVVLAGKVIVRDGDDAAAAVIAVHGPRRFLGELSLLTGQPTSGAGRLSASHPPWARARWPCRWCTPISRGRRARRPCGSGAVTYRRTR